MIEPEHALLFSSQGTAYTARTLGHPGGLELGVGRPGTLNTILRGILNTITRDHSDAGTGATVGTGTNSQTLELAVVLARSRLFQSRLPLCTDVRSGHYNTKRISRRDESRFHFRWNESCSGRMSPAPNPRVAVPPC